MNRCRFMKELGSYSDNQLSEIKKLQMGEHLRKCKICNEELAKLRALSEKLKSWQAPVLEPTFDSSLKNKIVALELAKETGKMKKRTLSILIPSGAVAGILVIAFLGSVYVKSFRTVSIGPASLNAGGSRHQIENEQMPTAALTRLSNESTYANSLSGYAVSASAQSLPENQMLKIVGFDKGQQHSASQGAVSYEGYYLDSSRARVASYKVAKSAQTLPAVGILPVVGGEGYQASEGRVIVIQPTLPATGVGEMIIRSAELTLEVESGKETHRKIADICREFSGYQAESNFSKDSAGRESGRVTLRIPKDKFLAALDKLSELGKVKTNNTYSQDVSQDYANLKAQLDAAMVVYNKMLEALQKRQIGIPEAVRLESELTPVLKKIENLKNQIEKLNNLTSFTTITVNFYEAEVSAKVLEETKQLVKENMLAAKIQAVRYFAQNLPFLGFVVGFAISVFAVILLLAILVTRFTRRG